MCQESFQYTKIHKYFEKKLGNIMYLHLSFDKIANILRKSKCLEYFAYKMFGTLTLRQLLNIGHIATENAFYGEKRFYYKIFLKQYKQNISRNTSIIDPRKTYDHLIVISFYLKTDDYRKMAEENQY